MTIVKVQKPIAGNGPPLWMVYDKFKARVQLVEARELPRAIIVLFESAPPGQGRFRQYLEDAEWNQDSQTWDLSKCGPVTRRLIW